MRAVVTTSPWLGERKDRWARETFPETMLNEQQVRTLFSVSEGGRQVIDLDLKPAILKITDEIVEIHTRFGHPGSASMMAMPTYFWLDADGNILAVVEEKYEGPRGVHPPGAKFRKWAVAYLRTPDMNPYDKAEERTYEHMWCISDNGAVTQVRQFIRDNWVNIDNKDDKE